MTSYNPEEAAPLVGMAASTIRLWCKTYAVGLSDGANPPPGTERRLTTQDVATLQQIKAWRDDRIATNDIVTLLQSAARQRDPAPLIVQPAPPSPQNATEGHSDTEHAVLVLSSMETRLAAVERNQERLLDDAWDSGFNRGVVVTVAVIGFLLLLAWLLTNGAPW